jgi:hypothetical protein
MNDEVLLKEGSVRSAASQIGYKFRKLRGEEKYLLEDGTGGVIGDNYTLTLQEALGHVRMEDNRQRESILGKVLEQIQKQVYAQQEKARQIPPPVQEDMATIVRKSRERRAQFRNRKWHNKQTPRQYPAPLHNGIQYPAPQQQTAPYQVSSQPAISYQTPPSQVNQYQAPVPLAPPYPPSPSMVTPNQISPPPINPYQAPLYPVTSYQASLPPAAQYPTQQSVTPYQVPPQSITPSVTQYQVPPQSVTPNQASTPPFTPLPVTSYYSPSLPATHHQAQAHINQYQAPLQPVTPYHVPPQPVTQNQVQQQPVTPSQVPPQSFNPYQPPQQQPVTSYQASPMTPNPVTYQEQPHDKTIAELLEELGPDIL